MRQIINFEYVFVLLNCLLPNGFRCIRQESNFYQLFVFAESPPPESVPSTPPAILSRRVVIVDPNTGNELTVQEALQNKLIDEATAKQLLAQEGDFQE